MDITAAREERLPDDEVAAHEAGHAVFYLIFGQPFVGITIEETDAYRGAVIIDVPAATAMRTIVSVADDTIMDLVKWCAGPVAESRQRGDNPPRIRHLIAEYDDPRLRDRIDDAGVIARIAWVLQRPIELVTRQGAGLALTILKRPSIHLTVERLRDALIEKRTISSTEARAIFDDTATSEDCQWARAEVQRAVPGIWDSHEWQ